MYYDHSTACTMIIVPACTMIMIDEYSTIILHACTMIIIHVLCPTGLMFPRRGGEGVWGGFAPQGSRGLWGTASPPMAASVLGEPSSDRGGTGSPDQRYTIP